MWGLDSSLPSFSGSSWQRLWLQPKANVPTGALRHLLLEEGLGHQELHRVKLTCGWRSQEQVSFLSQKESRLSHSKE